MPDTITYDDRGRGVRATSVGPFLIVLLECEQPLAPSSRHALAGLDEVTLGRGAARRWERRDGGLHLAIADARMSERHARLVAEVDGWRIEDAGSKNGVLIGGVRRDQAVLRDGDVFELGGTFFLFRDRIALPALPASVPHDVDGDTLAAPVPSLATFAPAFARDVAELPRIVRTPAAILLRGETGTGKEVAARAIHALGEGGPFVAVNCGALPETLVESELFGYRKGAFSGAREDRAGLVRSVGGGTLFLDEIGDLALTSQAALLRVLQEREVTPLGGTRPEPVEFRAVAATHRDLEQMIERGAFRRDLYARLATYTLNLPPLRERREDLGLLIAALLGRMSGVARFTRDAARAMVAHDWPLNVRELEGCLQVAIARAGDAAIGVEHLPPSVVAARPPVAPSPPAGTDRRAQLEALLKEHGGNISAVARATGRSRIQVHRWMRDLGIDPARYR